MIFLLPNGGNDDTIYTQNPRSPPLPHFMNRCAVVPFFVFILVVSFLVLFLSFLPSLHSDLHPSYRSVFPSRLKTFMFVLLLIHDLIPERLLIQDNAFFNLHMFSFNYLLF